jgi:hypothetical protein
MGRPISDLEKTAGNNFVERGELGMSTGRLRFLLVVVEPGAEPLRETEEVGAMQKLLAVLVLGASLAFASSVAIAGDHRGVEVSASPTEPAGQGYDTGYGTVLQPQHPALGVQFPL